MQIKKQTKVKEHAIISMLIIIMHTHLHSLVLAKMNVKVQWGL
jgi:hypothetical protein